jgi:asparagine synthase (glutamine-hydrolysing)
MCGISGIAGKYWDKRQLDAMLAIQHHRGPDAQDQFVSEDHSCGLSHNRLSIIDLSDSAKQPMTDATGRYVIVFNGEVYNYLEIKSQLEPEFRFKTKTDSEVILYAYIKWGEACLDKFIGMFAIAIWDNKEKNLWIARDRLGVKPLNYAFDNKGNFYFASEIKALHAAGILKNINEATWAAYLGYGRYDQDENTFWNGIIKLLPGHSLSFRNGVLNIKKWYDLSEHTGMDFDNRSLDVVTEEYLALLQESVRLRFRSDVPVGINLSGGLDSSALLSIVNSVQGEDSNIKAFTFITGDDRYDELPWVNEMISKTNHPLIPCLLKAKDVPEMASSVQFHEDEPFGGLPTLAYSRVFEEARKAGVIVLLDGQGMDEQWAGYDYYRRAETNITSPTIQGAKDSSVLPECLDPDFLALAQPWQVPQKYPDKLRNLQYRDAFYTKIPRALRFNDRVSMRSSTELREPFLDHRLFEIAFRQPDDFKINEGTGKWFMRQLLKKHLPGKVVEAPKRPLQTPQREWLREELKDWTISRIESAIDNVSFLNKEKVLAHWEKFMEGKSDNSFYIWQWISLSLMNVKSTNHVPSAINQ